MTNRPKTWSETIFGQAPNRGGRDHTRMELPLPSGWSTEARQPETQGPQKPGLVSLPPAAPRAAAAAIPPTPSRPAADALPLGSTPTPVANAAEIQAATTALAGYKAELSGVQAVMAAQAELDLPGLGTGLASRKAEIEGLIAGLEARLKALVTETVAPRFDASGAQAFGTAVDGVKAKAAEAGAMSIAIPVSAPNAGTVIQQLQQIIALGGQANVAVNNINVGAIRARSSKNSFSDTHTVYGAQ